MVCSYLFLYLLGISAYLINSNVAIIGGDPARLNQFPYLVSLQYDGFGHECGAGILNEKFILTGAHCVFINRSYLANKPMSILAGTNGLHINTAPAITRQVKKIFIPKEYVPDANSNHADIAVLMLKEPLGMTPLRRNMKQLKLPQNQNVSYGGKTAEIAGFGWNWITVKAGKEYGGNDDQILRYAWVDVHTECHRNIIKNLFGSIRTQKQICAQIKQRDRSHPKGICWGDSGGPLVYDGIVIGVSSRSPFGCSEKWTGSIYTRVAHYLDFIRRAMRDQRHSNMIVHELP